MRAVKSKWSTSKNRRSTLPAEALHNFLVDDLRTAQLPSQRRKGLLVPRKHLILLVLSLIMVDIAAALVASRPNGEEYGRIGSEYRRPSSIGLFLVPSRIHQRSYAVPKAESPADSEKKISSMFPTYSHLAPSQVLKGHRGPSGVSAESSPVERSPTAGVAKNNPQQKRNRRQRRKRGDSTATTSANATQTKRPSKWGNLPDIYWKSIPMEDLRHHPRFESLPLPETIDKLESLEDIRLFRQESWQWDAVHEGRCTTSQAVAALGFLESETGKRLGVPRSWQHGGQKAYHRLRQQALRTLEEMNEVLCKSNFSIPKDDKETTAKDQRVWTSPKDGNDGFPFAARYMREFTQRDVEERRSLSQTLSKSPGFDFSVRMMWGNAQEATALLTALNYFWSQDKGVILKEVGMCGGGLAVNHTSGAISDLLVGATPDGLLCYPNGTVEVLEVKNHCPFFATQNPKRERTFQRRCNEKRFSIQHFNIENAGVPPQYIPQLMMEMMCVGENCLSCIMIRQTATSGSLVLRVHRDNEWIKEMLYWLNRFQLDFVERDEPPPVDFFLQSPKTEDRERYNIFLEQTLQLRSRVEVLAYIPHRQVQRAWAVKPGISDLFLD